MKRANPLAVLGDIAAEVVPHLLDKSKSDAERYEELMRCVPDVLAAVAQKQEQDAAARRADFIAHHAAMLCQTVVETTEDEDGLRAAARRAVRLASYVYDYAEGEEQKS